MDNVGKVRSRIRRTPTPLAVLREVARQRGDHPALVFMRTPRDTSPRVVTYRDLADQTARAIGALRKEGVRSEDGVAILLPAIPEGVVALLAASSAGVAFPLNLLLSAEAMGAQLALARARVAIVLGAHPVLDVAARLSAAAAHAPMLEKIVEVPANDEPASATSWRAWLDDATPKMSFSGSPDRVAALFHTGGTTGEPKLAELSGRNLAAGALMGSAALRLTLEDRVLSGLPLFHVGGAICCVLSALATGATVIFPGLLGARDPDIVRGIWTLLAGTRASVLMMVPTSLAAIADVPVDGADLSSLRSIGTGASPLPRELGKRIEAKLDRPVCQIYGMTEASGFCTAQPFDGAFRQAAVGYAAPELELELRGVDGKRTKQGEVFYKGPNTFRGYRTKAGHVSGTNNGWVASGDLGVLGDDGQLRLLGRNKDVIIRSGHNIDPLIIEDVAQQHPAVRISAAVPMPDEYAGELPILYVALKSGAYASSDDIGSFVSERIAEPPARPKRVFIIDDLPLTPVGKIMRYKLRQAAVILRVGEVLSNLDIKEVLCGDPGAKKISIRWNSTPSSADHDTARQGVERLGLSMAAN